MTDAEFRERVATLTQFAFLALGGAIALALALTLAAGQLQGVVAVLAALMIVPAVIYFVLLTTWHWKGRYRGQHSELWGALLVLEVSGWFKLIYLFRHILPDARGTGRYRRASAAHAA